MRLKQDVISYVDLTGIEPTHVAVAEAIHALKGEFAKAPIEFRAGAPVTRALLAEVAELGVSVATVDEEGRVVVMGVPLKVLPESYDPHTFLAIMDTITLEVPHAT
jgi:hypothetical protein